MSIGIELIEKERQEQIIKHGRTIQHDIDVNPNGELCWAASLLSRTDDQLSPMELLGETKLKNWDQDLLLKMDSKSYKQRLIIAGALIAAELDRLYYIESEQQNKP